MRSWDRRPRWIRIGGGASYRDKIYGDARNTNVIPSCTIIDAVVGFYRPAWDLSLGVDNLTDVTYFTTALGAGARVGDPRSFFLRTSLRQ